MRKRGRPTPTLILRSFHTRGNKHGTIALSNNRERQLIAAWEAEGNVIPPYVAPPPSLQMDISDRRFFQQLAISGLITEEEAYTYMQIGQLPAAFIELTIRTQKPLPL